MLKATILDGLLVRQSVALSVALAFGVCHASLAFSGDLNAVNFDAPAIVIAEPINPAIVELPTMGGDLVRLRIPVSTYLSPEFRGTVAEYAVELHSPHQSMRIIDFWPKSEVYSEIDGTVSVETSQQKESHVSFNVSAAYEPIGRGSAEGDFVNKSQVQERYQRKPPMQILSSSGTIRRGFGVFFKFRPGPMPTLEGTREVAVLAEVPRGWRGDMLQISMRAVGEPSSFNSRPQTLGGSQLWITTHREGDLAAAAQATRYVTQERSLRALAASSQARVSERALPTFWHKLGASLDVVEPKIPSDYLTQIIFGMTHRYYDNDATNRLPVDLRVAILDYWETKQKLLDLAGTSKPAAVHVSLNDWSNP